MKKAVSVEKSERVSRREREQSELRVAREKKESVVRVARVENLV